MAVPGNSSANSSRQVEFVLTSSIVQASYKNKHEYYFLKFDNLDMTNKANTCRVCLFVFLCYK